jgi:hypothetical protein
VENIVLTKYYPRSSTIHILQPGLDPEAENPEEMLAICDKVAPYPVVPAAADKSDLLALVSCRRCRTGYMALLKATATTDTVQPTPAVGGLHLLLQAVAWSAARDMGYYKAANAVMETLLANLR